MTIITTQLTWQEFVIELTCRAPWCKAAPEVSHLEIRTIHPAKGALPMTGTGYRSHFFQCQTEMNEEELKALVLEWLEQESQSPEWQEHHRNAQQLTLF